MRIAIFHNYMDNIGGAERVGLTLARELKADLYSTVTNQTAIKKMGFNVKVKEIGWVPSNAPLRQQMALCRFRRLNLGKKYDYFLIDGDWAVSGAVNNKPNLWYVHSPTREIWDLYEYTRQNNVPIYSKWIFDCWVKYNRSLNRKYVKHINKLVCNSANTQKRVKKYLKRDSVVIYPPIEIKRFHYKKTGDYWLSVNRLINHKRVDLQMEVFRKMPNEKLVVVGCYEKSKHFQNYVNYISKIKPKNVTLLYWVDFKQLIDFYANCKAFITTSHDEDFGMTAVEAMASGKPVVAVNEGGYKETILNNITGKLVKPNVNKLTDALKEISKNPEQYKKECIKQAKKFDTRIFIKRIREEIQA